MALESRGSAPAPHPSPLEEIVGRTKLKGKLNGTRQHYQIEETTSRYVYGMLRSLSVSQHWLLDLKTHHRWEMYFKGW